MNLDILLTIMYALTALWEYTSVFLVEASLTLHISIKKHFVKLHLFSALCMTDKLISYSLILKPTWQLAEVYFACKQHNTFKWFKKLF